MAFQIYKGNQARNTRLGFAIGLSVVILVGCYKLYSWINSLSLGLNPRQMILLSTLVPAAVLAVLSGLSFWLVNRASVADFMIVSEGELKKVNWSSKDELYVSTVVVISVVVIMAALLGFSDFILGVIFQDYIFK